MDIGTLRGLVTIVLMALFVALVIWAYGPKRHAEFSAAARLPLDEEQPEAKERD